MKKSIYIYRKVLNSNDIKDWAKKQGFASCLANSEMHVTVAFDHRKHDWRDLPLTGHDSLDVLDPNERSIEEFKHGAIVLEIYAAPLTTRWAEIVGAGVHWKWEEYRPHVTITYNKPDHLDIAKIVPYDGIIRLGPEVVTEVIWNMHHRIDEESL